MSRYQKVLWTHQFEDEPIVLYSEVSDDGYEVRKVEAYRDGHLDYADASRAVGTTVLSEKTMPSIAEIAAQTEFAPESVTAEEFDQVWQRAVAQHD